MSRFKTLLRSLFGPPSLIDKLDRGPSPRETIQAMAQLERMSPAEAVPMLLDGIAHHPSSKVRCNCLKVLGSFDRNGSQIQVFAAALDDASAEVRYEAVSYFLLRGSQGRPVVSIVPKLVRMLEHPNASTSGDPGDERFAKLSLPMHIASALMTIVGAKKIQITPESPDMESFRRSLLNLRESTDPVLRSDAIKYLQILFGM
jgi:HEAT repeat protein